MRMGSRLIKFGFTEYTLYSESNLDPVRTCMARVNDGESSCLTCDLNSRRDSVCLYIILVYTSINEQVNEKDF